MQTRKPRPDHHRHSNDAAARAYGRVLRGYLQDIEKAPVPSAVVHTAIRHMQDVAVATFATAFLRGKAQAMGSLATMDPQDVMWVDRKLSSNNHYLSHSLAPDIAAKIERLRLDVPGKRSAALDASFGARVENLYGGAIWNVHEAGFASGARDLQFLVRHLGHPSLHQDDPPADSQSDQQKKDHWLIIAILLGMNVDDLKAHFATLQIGISYICVNDNRSCGGCSVADGDYWPPSIAPIPGEFECGFNCRCFTELISRTV